MLDGFPHQAEGEVPPANSGRSSRIIFVPVLIAIASCSTIAVPHQSAQPALAAAARPKAFVCRAFVRPDPYTQPAEKWDGVWGKAKPLGEISLAEPGDRSLSSETFRFRVLYENDRYEGSSLDTFVYLKSDGKLVQQTKFQFGAERHAPSSQFADGHGFTGLHYVYAPGSREELQYWCSYE
jgi:hypothetical protein